MRLSKTNAAKAQIVLFLFCKYIVDIVPSWDLLGVASQVYKTFSSSNSKN